MPLFNPYPKTRKEEFYDREKELEEFNKYINNSPLTLVLGLRRYGKTSLILTGLNENNKRYIFIDCRLLPQGMLSMADLTRLFEKAFNNFLRKYHNLRHRLLKLLENIKGIRVHDITIMINPSKTSFDSIVDLFSAINELDEDVILVIDEAQELRRVARYRIDSILAYTYDHLHNIRIVLSGSQIGLLYRFLRITDPQAPLYGRVYVELKLSPLSREQSQDFLEKGFTEQGLRVSKELVDYIVDRVDGVIGWLTYIGYELSLARCSSIKLVDKVLDKAALLVRQELENFLKLRLQARIRYLAILEAISVLGEASWKNIYTYLEAKVGRVPKPVFNELLRNLVDAGFVVKKEPGVYVIADPVLQYAIKNKLIAL